ncbi:MAG TPA: SRPBCC domain-containing protein [Sphingobium sp.]
MDLKFTVSIRIAKPVHEVFEAVADPAKLSAYFTTGGAQGRLESGERVMWDFHDFPGAFPVNVVEAIQDEKIVLRWPAHEGQDEGRAEEPYYNDVVFTFEPLDGNTRTLVSVSEGSWRETPAGLKGAFGNCFGWSQMVCALKAWLEYGINLREGAFK